MPALPPVMSAIFPSSLLDKLCSSVSLASLDQNGVASLEDLPRRLVAGNFALAEIGP
jgi:hypothetical protein